jgi:predicted nucleic acid-binding protein
MRRLREGSLGSNDERAAYRVFQSLMQTWIEIQPSETVRSTAERLLTVHRLRTADAFQLAAAIEWRQGSTTGQGFVVFDQRLRHACRLEGFSVLPESF